MTGRPYTILRWIPIATLVARGANAQSMIPDFSARVAPAQLTRQLPARDTTMLGIFDPIWHPGIFAVSGNPAGLPWELAPAIHEYVLRHDTEQGAYRRPLDALDERETKIVASGWQPVTLAGAMIGRIVVDQQRMAPGPFADQANPYASNPFVTVDTSSSAITAMNVAMDGSAGWALGRTAFGITLGYETRDAHTVEAGFVRLERSVVPGANAGVARRLHGGTSPATFTVGLAAGWHGGAETVDLVDRANAGRAYEIAGLTEPKVVNVSEIDPSYYHRFEQSSEFVGASGALAAKNLHIATGIESAQARYRDWIVPSDHPPASRWSPRSIRANAGAEYRSAYGLLQLRAEWTALHGSAQLASDSTGAAFETREHETVGWAVFRTPIEAAWAAALAFSLSDWRHVQADTAPGVFANLRSRTPSLQVTTGRWLTRIIFAEAGFELSRFTVRGAIPSLRGRDDAYRTYIAPELELYATPARENAMHASVRWCLDRRASLWLQGSVATASPEARLPLTNLPPTGSRRLASIRFGVTVLPTAGEPNQRTPLTEEAARVSGSCTRPLSSSPSAASP
jgi:hypothetical protein